MKHALVVNGSSYAEAIMDLGLNIITDENKFFENPAEFDLIMFTGGEDVSPALYGDDSPLSVCYYSTYRDAKESKVYQVALKHGIKMTGICRGIQFLNVMNGGKMMHHLDGHAGSVHGMMTAYGEEIYVNSLHHQMCIPGPDAVLVGWSSTKLSAQYVGKNDEPVDYDGPETEALIYPLTGCAGVQYHPEMMRSNSEGAIWYSRFIYDLLNMPMDEFVRNYTTARKANASTTSV